MPLRSKSDLRLASRVEDSIVLYSTTDAAIAESPFNRVQSKVGYEVCS